MKKIPHLMKLPIPTNWSGDPKPTYTWYVCPHCNNQSPLEDEPKRELLTDMELRNLWADHAAKTHGWPKAGASPMHDLGNGLRFETPWHETEYGIFKAGYEAAHRIQEKNV